MDTLRSGVAAVADGISSLAAGVTGTDASKQEHIHKEGTDSIKDQVDSRSTSQPASTTEQEQIHKEGTEYIKDQVFNQSASAKSGDLPAAVANYTPATPREVENTANPQAQQEKLVAQSSSGTAPGTTTVINDRNTSNAYPGAGTAQDCRKVAEDDKPTTSVRTHAIVNDTPTAGTGTGAHSTTQGGLPNMTYLPGQQQYGLPGPAGYLPVDPATSNSGLSFKHPGQELDRERSEQDDRNRPLNSDLIRNDPASHAAAGAPDALHRPYSENEPHGPRQADEPHGKHEKDGCDSGKESAREHLDHQTGMRNEHPESIPTAGGQQLGTKHWSESKKID
ncbi:hypothetical protein AC579_904 [Pseudocercospora musae]|uniref:Uncharacterized protein n=1 Tax=Pseudocercospora musae TaxID=113226 RepID=A0A139IN08_9PEZI|nr:hypothetical protein AC579_904 [Pseudocercospora musae]